MSEFDPQVRGASPFRRWLRRVFPERQIMVRTQGDFRALKLSSHRQLFVFVMGMGLFGWFTYSTAVVIWMDAILERKDQSISDTREAYKAILAEVGVYRTQARVVLDGLEAQVLSFKTDEENAAIAAEKIANAEGVVDTDRNRQDLVNQLAYIENGLTELTLAQNLLTDLEEREVETRRILLQHDITTAENRQLHDQVALLEARLKEVEAGHVRLVESFSEVTQTKIATLEKVLSGAGLDVGQLMKRQRDESAKLMGQGGPFVPLDMTDVSDPAYPDAAAALQDNVEAWAMMQVLSERLPLVEPVNTYRVTSPFGGRADPFNKLQARHEGMDMAAPRGTPIMASAPGKIVYAGWRGRYGRVVDIDHGMGVITRYAHMDTIGVQMGQKVKRGDSIGTVGNTGRSTGPHLHYEIRVNGRPSNPQNFMKAGKNVFEG